MTANIALPERTSVEADVWQTAQQVVCDITVEIPLVSFDVRGLLGLADGSILATTWSQTGDVPLQVNGTLVAWAEFEVVGDKLAVRVTELA